MKKLQQKSLLLLLVTATIAACSSGDGDGSNTQFGSKLCVASKADFCAIVNTKLSDSADVQVVTALNESYDISSGLLPGDQTDFVVNSYGDDIYRLGRYNIDSINKYANSGSLKNLYVAASGHEGYSTGSLSNPYEMAFVSETKAYIALYGSDQVWIVDPSATNEASFKLGTLSLSAYNNNGSVNPDVFSVKVVGDKLYVFMQGLDDAGATFADDVSGSKPYVAVFDTTTNLEVDTGKGEGSLKGIPLPAKNPGNVSYHASVGFLISAVSDYSKTSGNAGIIKLNPTTYVASLLIGDQATDGTTSFVAGAFSNVTVLDATRAYLVSYQGWKNNNLYAFNPTTGQVDAAAVVGFTGINIAMLATDPDGNGWVGVGDDADPRIHVFNSLGTQVDRLNLNMNPNSVAFITP